MKILMKIWNSCIVMLVGAAFLGTVPAQAQTTGAVSVTVVDAASGQTLEAALIYIPALDLGGYSDDQGRFTLSDVPVGEHEVSVELIGFSRASATVAVQAGQTTAVELRMEPAAILFEETAVTGTAFKESPINLPYAVTTASREKLKEQGSPQPVDFFKNLSASHGVIGERSSWYNANQAATLSESIANVNLRGLGASRTLVLFNGRRQTYVPARLIGGRFVDVNAIPSIALDRVEVLKEGAAAIYGSDAVAGVANFLTRSDFTGFEVSANHEYIADAGDTDVGAIWGGKLGGANAIVAGEWRKRRELPSTDRDYLLQPWHGGGQRFGWSSIGNPGTFAVGTPAPWTAAIHAPQCEQFGGYRESWTCRFRYQQYENLIEDMSHIRAFTEINGALDNGTEYHFEGLWAQAEIPNWYTTPSYPPFPLTDTSIMEVAPDHPGREAFCEDYGPRTATSTTTNAREARTRTGTSTAVRSATRVPGGCMDATPAPGAWRPRRMAISCHSVVARPTLIWVSPIPEPRATTTCRECTSSGSSSASGGSGDPTAASASRRIPTPSPGCGSARSAARWRVRAIASTTTPLAMPSSSRINMARSTRTKRTPVSAPPLPTAPSCGTGWQIMKSICRAPRTCWLRMRR